MKIGTRLLKERQDRKPNQADMADLLGLTAPTYSRLERNETSVDLDKVVDMAKKLNIPIQEFLPETIMINGDNKNSQNAQGLVLGNIYNYNYTDKETAQRLAEKEIENESLREKIILLESKIGVLENIVTLIKKDNDGQQRTDTSTR